MISVCYALALSTVIPNRYPQSTKIVSQVPSMASKRVNILSLRTQMRNNMVRSESGHLFLPDVSVGTIFTMPAIKEAIQELECQPDERIGLAEKIHCGGKKTFAILILMGDEDYIVKFRNYNALDNRLPLNRHDAQKIAGEVGVSLADDYQWKLLSLTFPAKMWEHHWEIDNEKILPFIGEPEQVATGAFGEIHKVKILPSQQDFYPQAVS